MSICTSSGDETFWNSWYASINSPSVGLSLCFLALASRNEYHAVERHRSGMPFQVRSMSFELCTSNSKVMPPPFLPFFVGLAILVHLSSRSHSFFFIARKAAESTPFGALPASTGRVSMSAASSVNRRSRLCGRWFVALRNREVDRRIGELYVLCEEVGRTEGSESLRVGERPVKERLLARADGGRIECFRRGVSDARSRLVETRWIGLGSIPSEFVTRMKPYLSTSPAPTFCQYSIPPANSFVSFLRTDFRSD